MNFLPYPYLNMLITSDGQNLIFLILDIGTTTCLLMWYNLFSGFLQMYAFVKQLYVVNRILQICPHDALPIVKYDYGKKITYFR